MVISPDRKARVWQSMERRIVFSLVDFMNSRTSCERFAMIDVREKCYRLRRYYLILAVVSMSVWIIFGVATMTVFHINPSLGREAGGFAHPTLT